MRAASSKVDKGATGTLQKNSSSQRELEIPMAVGPPTVLALKGRSFLSQNLQESELLTYKGGFHRSSTEDTQSRDTVSSSGSPADWSQSQKFQHTMELVGEHRHTNHNNFNNNHGRKYLRLFRPKKSPTPPRRVRQPTPAVKCPSQKPPPRDAQQDDVDNMKRLYDMRTWDMYIRITESRKRKQTRNATMIAGDQTISFHQLSPANTPTTTNTSNYTTLEEDHEMIFDMDS